jgi:hypothetical protein
MQKSSYSFTASTHEAEMEGEIYHIENPEQSKNI